MKKVIISLFFLLVLFFTTTYEVVFAQQQQAQVPLANPAAQQAQPAAAQQGQLQADEPPIIVCGCPTELTKIYDEKQNGERCIAGDGITAYNEFLQDPAKNHLWVEDPEITAQGKTDERARQFIYWAVTHNSIDDHQVLKSVWNTARNVAYFLVLLVAAIMGLSMIIAQKNNFSTSVKVWPAVMKILGILLFITFSSSIVITIIQLSDILMKFFIESLGGKDLFNIYFGSISQEPNYVDFVGCRDLNIRVQEGVQSEMVMLKITNITYYVMGTMIILRKVLLWFLMFVSPFLAILAPFIFIRNIGWIWIGVFFQWVFYGPLFALFLGALATIWKVGIPFLFDFSRTHTAKGYIYPTAINILYGGPAQKLGIVNNGNYSDTFAEYIITLIMLWAVTFFPWWLLRIFRDYCCDGINAMKNILMSMYDQSRNPPSPGPTPTPTPTQTNIGTAMKIPKEIPVTVKIETIEQIKRAKTEDITKSLHVSTQKLTDIARFETNKQTNEVVKKNLNFLKNPIQAETPTERQKFMSIRTELFNRAVKNDVVAKQILSTISSSRTEQMQRRTEILSTIPQTVPVTHVVSVKVNVPHEKVQSVTSSFANAASSNTNVVNQIAQKTQLQSAQVQAVLKSFKQNINQPAPGIIKSITESSGIKKEQVAAVVQTLTETAKQNKDMVKAVAEQEGVNQQQVEQIVAEQVPILAEPEKHVEETITVPPVSIEEYEEVKKMWMKQYESGEVPVQDNIKTREQWVEQDIIFITNAMNKLFSPNEELKQQGLDDIGYILPIFLINNMKGEELIVYLKAKLEAAKQVKKDKDKEKEITEKLKGKTEEEFVEVSSTKHEEAAKTMEMKQELKIEGEEKQEKSEDSTSQKQEKTTPEKNDTQDKKATE